MKRSAYEQLVKKVDWTRLPGACGVSFPVADHLLAASSNDENTAGEAVGELIGHMCHQGVLEDGAPAVVTLLLQSTEIDEEIQRWIPLSGVERMANVAGRVRHQFGFLPGRSPFGGKYQLEGIKDIVTQGSYEALSEHLLDSVRKASPHLCKLLLDDDSRTRAYSVRLLGICGREDSFITDILAQAIDQEVSESVRAGILLSLSCRAVCSGQICPRLLESVQHALNSDGAIEHASAIVASLLTKPSEILANHLGVVREALLFEGEIDFLTFPWENGQLVGLVAEALSKKAAPEELVAEVLMHALEHWDFRHDSEPRMVEWREEDLILTWLVFRVFAGHRGRRDYLERDELSPIQRTVLARVSRLMSLDTRSFTEVGIRNLRSDADRLIGLSSGGLDERLDGIWESRRVCWPLWKWWHQALIADHHWDGRFMSVARDHVIAKMKRDLSPRAIFFAAEDAVSGAYDVPHAPLVRLVADVAESIPDLLEQYVNDIGPEPNGAQAALAVVPSLALAASRDVSWLDHIRAWTEIVTPADLKTEAFDLAHQL